MKRVLVVTGARKGIGRSVAEHWLDQGWHVAGCSRRESSLQHPQYLHFELDVGDEAAVGKMFRAVVREFGGVDALLNNAGIASMNHFLTTPVRSAEEILHTNVVGSFICMREAAKAMRKRGSGRIVNLTSVAVPLALEGEALYGASKAAVENLTRTAAREFSPWHITVNAIGPGPVKTGLIAGVPEERIEKLVSRQAIPRMGTATDIINVVDFYLRPESEFITGQVIYLGGPYG